MFIAMDPPKHDVQRKAVSPIVAPAQPGDAGGMIRERAAESSTSLPLGETFDWVDQVSIELTTQMLATLFDFPFEDRRKLTRWSDVATRRTEAGASSTREEKRAGRAAARCLAYFTRLWNERVERAAASPT